MLAERQKAVHEALTRRAIALDALAEILPKEETSLLGRRGGRAECRRRRIRRRTVIEIIRTSIDEPAEAIVGRVFEAIDRFAGDVPQFDDITILVLRRHPQAS